MDVSHPTTYRDKHGEVATSIRNDGHALTMVVRGIEFSGNCLDDSEPTDTGNPSRLASFTFQQACSVDASGKGLTEPRDTWLTGFTIDTEMPIPVVVDDHVENGTLLVHLDRVHPQPARGLADVLLLVLCLGGARFSSSGTSGWFEDELLSIQKQLPKGTYMKTCINCAFSDYHPVGHEMFGTMLCFRWNKDAYLAVKGKHDLFRICRTVTESVQETYLCPEFQRRVPGTGYRG